jgi:hypothetical protein
MERKDQPPPITPQLIASIAREQRWRAYVAWAHDHAVMRRCVCGLPEEQVRDAALRGYVDEHGCGLPIEMPPVDPLAEWIFARHIQPARTFDSLYDEAREDAVIGPGLLKKDFQTAFNSVYATKRRHPPAGGWPLQPEYQQRWRA